MHNRPLMKQRLDSGELANIWQQLQANPESNATRLWWEVDTLRFELTGANEHIALLREEIASLNKQLYAVRAELPRNAGPM